MMTTVDFECYHPVTLCSSDTGEGPLTNLTDTLLTQWRSFVGVIRSPTKTWPRWPPHCAQVISMRCIPCELSVVVSTLPL